MAAEQSDVYFANKLIVTKIKELQAECIDIRKGTSDVGELVLLDKAEEKCKVCLHLLEKGQDAEKKEMLLKIVQHYSQALLDATYVTECRLVNEDFPQDKSKEEIRHLIGRLNEPQLLVKEMFGSESETVEILGTDVMECLCWRRGALFYMYCHTLFNDPSRRQLNKVHLLECAESGVIYLESMLSIRSPLVLDDHKNVNIKDADMVHLLQEGIFSNTHLLGLMYAGEMCYWYWQIVKETKNIDVSADDTKTARNFDSLANGKKFLQKFVDIVKANFQGKGWDCSRAEQLLAEFHVS